MAVKQQSKIATFLMRRGAWGFRLNEVQVLHPFRVLPVLAPTYRGFQLRLISGTPIGVLKPTPESNALMTVRCFNTLYGSTEQTRS